MTNVSKTSDFKRKLAILAFDKLIRAARQDFCFHIDHCSNCVYCIDPDSADYVDTADGKNCYARRFHEEIINMLTKKEGIV